MHRHTACEKNYGIACCGLIDPIRSDHTTVDTSESWTLRVKPQAFGSRSQCHRELAAREMHDEPDGEDNRKSSPGGQHTKD